MKTKRIKALFIAAIFAFESMAVGYAPVSVQAVSENTVKKEAMPAPATDEVTPEKATIKYSGVDGDLSWSIDEEGKLLVSGTGDYEGEYMQVNDGWVYVSCDTAPKWINYRSEITSAEINVQGITNTSDMFVMCGNLKQIKFTYFDTSNVTNMGNMFCGCRSLTELDLSGFNTKNVTNMWGMFEACSGVMKLDLSGFDTSNVGDMGAMFRGCSKLENLNLSGFNTENVTSMRVMFSGCYGLKALNVSSLETGNVTDMWAMFQDCYGLKSLDVSNFDTGNVTNMKEMFGNCHNMTTLNISSFDTTNVTDMENMLDYCCSALTTIYAPNNQSSCMMMLPKTEHSWLYQSTGEVVTAITNAGTYVRIDSLMPEEKGTRITDSKSRGNYRVTNANANAPTVEYVGTTTPKKTKVTIPEYVTYKNIKYKVTSVASKAFKGNKKLKNVSIATSITKIGNDAFNGCTNLKTVTIGKSLKTIGKNAFKNCKKLTKITLKSKRLKSVGKNALKGVNKNCKIKVPAAKVKLYKKLFKNKGLKKVKVTK